MAAIEEVKRTVVTCSLTMNKVGIQNKARVHIHKPSNIFSLSDLMLWPSERVTLNSSIKKNPADTGIVRAGTKISHSHWCRLMEEYRSCRRGSVLDQFKNKSRIDNIAPIAKMKQTIHPGARLGQDSINLVILERFAATSHRSSVQTDVHKHVHDEK